MSLQYLEKDLIYEVDVLHVDKHESLLQIDKIIFDGFGQAWPYLEYLCDILRKMSDIKSET